MRWREALYRMRIAWQVLLLGACLAACALNGHPVLAAADAAFLHGRPATALVTALVAGFTVALHTACALRRPRSAISAATVRAGRGNG